MLHPGWMDAGNLPQLLAHEDRVKKLVIDRATLGLSKPMRVQDVTSNGAASAKTATRNIRKKS